jgi:hypothetical protein
MPIYEITAPNGRTYEIEGPSGASKEDAVRALLAKFPEAGKKPPEPTMGGYVQESLKAIPRGFVGGLESAALGAAALLPGDTETGFERTAREGIKGLAERFKPSVAAGYEEAIPVKLAEAVGSMGTLLIPGGAAGLAAKGLGAAQGAQRVAQLAATTPVAGAMGAGEARERAVAAGATPEQIQTATAAGVVPGLAEMLPVERIFRRMPDELKGGILERVKRALVTGGFEGAQEAASAVAQNLIAKGVYKPSQELIEGVGEQAAYGVGAGAIVQFLVDAVAGRRAPPKGAAERAQRLEEERTAAEKQAVVDAFNALPGEVTADKVAAADQKIEAIKADLKTLGKQQRGGSPEANALRQEIRKLQQIKKLGEYGGTQTDLFGEVGGGFTPLTARPEAATEQDKQQFLTNYRRALNDLEQISAQKAQAEEMNNQAAISYFGRLEQQRKAALDAFEEQGKKLGVSEDDLSVASRGVVGQLQSLRNRQKTLNSKGNYDEAAALQPRIETLEQQLAETTGTPLEREAGQRAERQAELFAEEMEAKPYPSVAPKVAQPEVPPEVAAKLEQLQGQRAQLVDQKKTTSGARAKYIQNQIDALDQDINALQQQGIASGEYASGAVFGEQALEQLTEAQEARLQQARDVFNTQRQQRAEEAGLEQAGARAEVLAKEAPLEAILIGKGIKLRETDVRRKYLERVQANIDSGKITTQVASLLGLPSGGIDLSQPEQAQRALPTIEARLRELMSTRNNEFPNMELVKDGALTKAGTQLVGVEATIGELRRLQSVARQYAQELSPAEAGLTGVFETVAGKETKQESEEAIRKRASDINKFAEQRKTQMFNWGNEIDSLRKGDDKNDVSRKAAELRAKQVALLARMEAVKRVQQMGAEMPVEAQQQLEEEIGAWLGRITNNAKPGEPAGAFKTALKEAGVGKEGAIERGMTIADTKEGELARLQQGVDRMINNAVEKFKPTKPKKKVGPFGLTQQSAAVLSQRYDEQQAAAEPEAAPEPDLSGKQREMFPGSITEVTKKKQAVAKRAATIAAKKTQRQEETKALMQKAAALAAEKQAEKAEKQKAATRRATVKGFWEKLRSYKKDTAERNLKERAISLRTFQDKLKAEIAEVEAEQKTERQADIRLSSLASLGKITHVKFGASTEQHLKVLRTQLAAVTDKLAQTERRVAQLVQRDTQAAEAKAQKKAKTTTFVPAGQVVTPEDTRPLAKKITSEEQAARDALANIRERVETQERFVAETEDAIDTELKRIDDILAEDFADTIKGRGYARQDLELLADMEFAAGLSDADVAKLKTEARGNVRFANAYRKLVARESYRQKLRKESAILQQAKADLKPFRNQLKALQKQEASLAQEQRVKALRARVLKFLDTLAASMSRTEEAGAAETRRVKDVLADIAQGKIKGSEGLRGVPKKTLTLKEEKEVADLEDQLRKIDPKKRAAAKLRMRIKEIKRTIGVVYQQKMLEGPMDLSEIEAAQTDIETGTTAKERAKEAAQEEILLKLRRQRAALAAKVTKATEDRKLGTNENIKARTADVAKATEALESSKKAAAEVASLGDTASGKAWAEAAKVRQREADLLSAKKALERAKEVRALLGRGAETLAKMTKTLSDAGLVITSNAKKTAVAQTRAVRDTLSAEGRAGKRTLQPLRTGITEETAIFPPEQETDFRDATDADTGVDAGEAKTVADRVQKALPEGIKFVYAPTLVDAPAAFKKALERSGRTAAKGAVMPDGTVIVVGEAHKSTADLQETIAHELIGHYGADMVLGKDGVQALTDKLFGRGLDHVAEVAVGLGVYPDIASARIALGASKPQVNMTRRRLLQAAGAAIAKPVMPLDVSKAFEITDPKAALDDLYDAWRKADKWVNKIVKMLPSSLQEEAKDVLHTTLYRIGGENFYEAWTNQGEDWVTASLIEEAVEKEGVKTLTANIKRAYDVAAADIAALVKPQASKQETKETAATQDFSDAFKTTFVRELIARAAEGRRVAPTFAEKVKTFIRDMIGAVRGWFRNSGLSDLAKQDTKQIQALIRDAERELKNSRPGVYISPDGNAVFRDGASSDLDWMSDTSKEVLQRVVAQEKSAIDTVKGNVLGLTGVTQFIDRTAPFLAALQKGVATKKISELEASQARYYLVAHDKRMNFTRNVAANGPLELKKFTEGAANYWMVQNKEGKDNPTLLKMFKALGESGMNADEAGRVFTLWLAAQRVKNEGIGVEALNYGKDKDGKPLLTAEKLRGVEKDVASQPKIAAAFEKARKEYNAYNAGLIDFAVQAGRISPEVAADLKRKKDYIPFYRQMGGEVKLFIGSEGAPITIGNLKDQPYLNELVGGDKPIQDVFTSSIQNTHMLTDMALRNITTKNVVYTLRKLGMLEAGRGGMVVRPKAGPASPLTIRFMENGVEKHAIVKTEGTIFEDIPAELLVKGLEGVKTTFPAALQLLGAPAKLLRRFVVLNPLYPVRQIMRDSLSAYGTSGADFNPIFDPVRNVVKAMIKKSPSAKELEERGLLGGQLLAGEGLEGMSTILRGVTGGKGNLSTALAWLESKSMYADVGTRVSAYDSYKRMGFNDLDAFLATNDIIDFNRRGMSPSVYFANTLIPFFNTQLQSLNVTYRAARGRMPYEERLDIKNKFVRRGIGMAVMTMLYAALMEDDEAYKNATPEQRLANWFVRVPGLDEPVRIPIPFEYGLLFKAIPEAVVNVAFGTDEGAPIAKGLATLAWQSVPNLTPQVGKPFIELATGKDLFTGADVETARMQRLDPTERFKDDTTELAKVLSSVGQGVLSPVQIDQFVRGVGTQLAVAVMSAANPILRDPNTPPSPEMKASKLPVVGSLMQPNDGNRVIDYVYEQMGKAEQARNTYNKLMEEGRDAEAERYINREAGRIALSDSVADFRKEMKDIRDAEEAIKRDPDMTSEQKRDELTELRKLKLQIAADYRDIIRQSSE